MIKSRRRRPKVTIRTIATSAVPVNGEYYSRAIGRALDVLECFHDGETSLSLTDISRLGGLP